VVIAAEAIGIETPVCAVQRERHAAAMTVDIRPLVPAEVEPAWAVLERAFGGTPHPEETAVELSVVDRTF
jgi:hypothetical protein